MRSLPETQRRTLAELSAVLGDRTIVVIGATALQAHLGAFRHSDDLDVVVSVDMDGYPGPLEAAPGWTRGRHAHQWRSPEGWKLDIVPAGPALLAAGEVRWADRTSSLLGLRHAFGCAERIEGLARVGLCPLHVAALLKIIAFQDRPEERGKDLEDLLQILMYYEESSNRRFDDVPLESDITYEERGAYLIGHDLGAIVDRSERTAVAAFLDEAEGGRLEHRLLLAGPVRFRENPQDLQRLLTAMRVGLGEGAG